MKRGSQTSYTPGRPMSAYCAKCNVLMYGTTMKDAVYLPVARWIHDHTCPPVLQMNPEYIPKVKNKPVNHKT